MYHKNRRNHRRFYPEFYDDDEIEVNKDIELKLEPEPDENIQELSAVQEIPANYNDLLYPSRLKTDSVFKQLENMQKDYIQKKLAVSRANNSSINPDITGSDKIINRNEAAAINENNNKNNNEIRLEIPDSMYTDEIQGLHNNIMDENINEAEEIMTGETDETETLYKMTYDTSEDVLSHAKEISEDSKYSEYSEDLEKTGEAVETFEHIQLPETYKIATNAEDAVPKAEQFDQSDQSGQLEYHEPLTIESPEQFEASEPFEVQIEESFSEEPIINIADVIERDYSAHRSELHEYNPKLIPFDKVKAIEYAHRWALDRNPNFLDFDELGGDCTNYISQILLAGGCKMDHTPVYGWYYSSGSEKSPSWTGVEQLYNYLIKEKKYGIIAKEISAEEAEAGDIVQLSFNGRNFQHTPFIVEVSRNANVPFHYDSIKICAHSFDSQNRALDTYQWRKIRFIHILGYLEK